MEARLEYKTTLLDQMRQVVRLTHLSIRTEEAYSLSHMTLHFFAIQSCPEGFPLLTPPCPPANSGLLHCA